jgi:subtilase family serine protease
VDITDAPNGVYALHSTVDPDNQLRESNEDNNAATVYIEIINNRVRVLSKEDAIERMRMS